MAKKAAFWSRHWFLLLLLLPSLLLLSYSDIMHSATQRFYDLGMRWSVVEPNRQISVIAIDDRSIANLGRWPWPRDIHAGLLDILRQSDALAVGYTVLFAEPQHDPGLSWIERIYAAHQTIDFPLKGRQKDAWLDLEKHLQEAQKALGYDQRLGDSLATHGKVLLGMSFLQQAQQFANRALPSYVEEQRLQQVQDPFDVANRGLLPRQALGILPPIAILGTQASAIGHIALAADTDGVLRHHPLVLRYRDGLYPSLPLLLASRAKGLSAAQIEVVLGRGLRLSDDQLVTDAQLRLRGFFYPPSQGQDAFPVDSFYDVISGRINAEKYRNQLVLVGPAATGVDDGMLTPVAQAMPTVVVMAHTLSNILNGDFLQVPLWGAGLSWLCFVFVALFLWLLYPRLSATFALLFGGLLLLLLLALSMGLLISQKWMVDTLPAIALLLAGNLLFGSRRFWLSERRAESSDQASQESNRLLGLSFQGQGQLELAFEKLRNIPLDETMLEPLYNLALDFERKRQFNKATSVYNHMAKYDADYRDIAVRRQKTQNLQETVVLGSASSLGTEMGNALTASDVEKPLLGRYQIEKELGRGAMGIVYYGSDPQIGRKVAIKTMALSQSFEADELAEAKARFFREAETAGRLVHPHIVTIYDAGEEHDLAYIAMEYIAGGDIGAFLRDGNKPPLNVTLDIALQIASALDYAHQQKVVHRDIKPANIMYDSHRKGIKITDFGIARITDSSKTKTGMIMGTPSYMSPEQLAGQHVDGRSDLFSLGVLFYQMLAGELPFQADSMATLMYKITNEPAPGLRKKLPNLPYCVLQILNKSLQKQPQHRYQTGAQFHADLLKCQSIITSSGQKKDLN